MAAATRQIQTAGNAANLRMIGQDFTLDTGNARREPGYAPVTTRTDGLAAMHAAAKR